MSRTGLKETQHGRQEPEPLLEDVPLERPSLHSARHSWRSGRPQSWAPDDRDDRRSYRAIASYDYGTPSKAPAGREYADSYFDYRGSYYDHPYSHYPFYPPPSQRRSVPPRGSWRSSSTITALPTQGPPPPPPQAAEESGDETEDERTPTPRPKRLQQRPLTWGYDYTPPPPSTEAIMRLPFTWWMNSGVKDRKGTFQSSGKVLELTYRRFCVGALRVCGNDHVPVFCICRHSSCQYQRKQRCLSLYDKRSHGLLTHRSHLHLTLVWLQSDGQRLDLLSHLRRTLQPRRHAWHGHGQIFELHPRHPPLRRTNRRVDYHLSDCEGAVSR